jgi:hypothetical protein
MRTPDLTPEAARDLAAIEDALAGRTVEPDLTDLGELALALRDERPEISEDFAASLDARRWGERERRRRKSREVWPGFAPAFAASILLALVVSVAVLGGGGDDGEMGSSGSSEGGGSVAASEVQDAGGGEEAASSAPGAASRAKPTASDVEPLPPAAVGGGGNAASDSLRNRMIERSASLTLAARPRDVDKVAAGVLRVTDAVGGFVRNSTVASSTDGGGGTFELRIPTARLNRALADLSQLARVRERTQSSQDITGSFVSARDRLQDAEAERRALLRALSRATTLNETAGIRARLRLVGEEIAAAKRGVARVRNRASYSTVAVTLIGDRTLGSGDPGDDGSSWSPGDAWRDAGRILEVAAGVALIALAVLLPLSLVALAAWVAARQVTRRRRERALDAV